MSSHTWPTSDSEEVIIGLRLNKDDEDALSSTIESMSSTRLRHTPTEPVRNRDRKEADIPERLQRNRHLRTSEERLHQQFTTASNVDCLFVMKQQARQAAVKPQARTHRATGTNLPAGCPPGYPSLCAARPSSVCCDRVAPEGSVSAWLVDLVKSAQRTLENAWSRGDPLMAIHTDHTLMLRAPVNRKPYASQHHRT
jgi:hypothetical protein